MMHLKAGIVTSSDSDENIKAFDNIVVTLPRLTTLTSLPNDIIYGTGVS